MKSIQCITVSDHNKSHFSFWYFLNLSSVLWLVDDVAAVVVIVVVSIAVAAAAASCISNIITFNYSVLTFSTVVYASSDTNKFDQTVRRSSLLFLYVFIHSHVHIFVWYIAMQYSSSLFTFNTGFIICDWKYLPLVLWF